MRTIMSFRKAVVWAEFPVTQATGKRQGNRKLTVIAELYGIRLLGFDWV